LFNPNEKEPTCCLKETKFLKLGVVPILEYMLVLLVYTFFSAKADGLLAVK
jgi:hypothetical protein